MASFNFWRLVHYGTGVTSLASIKGRYSRGSTVRFAFRYVTNTLVPIFRVRNKLFASS